MTRFSRRAAALVLIAALTGPMIARPAFADGPGGRGSWGPPTAYLDAPPPMVHVAPPYYPPARPPVPAAAYACSNGIIAGGLVGAATGGLIGSQLVQGPGNAGATIFGIIGGAMIGAAIGQSAGDCD
jgi:hypothetical protein